MEETDERVVGSTGPVSAEAVPVLKPEVVDEVLARLGRGEPVKRLASEYGIDRKTVRAWRVRGCYQPRAPRPRKSILDPHAAWLMARAPEVDFNSAVLHRELKTHFGFAGSEQQVLRFVRPLRVAARPPRATVRFETPPGQQAQVDFGQRPGGSMRGSGYSTGAWPPTAWWRSAAVATRSRPGSWVSWS